MAQWGKVVDASCLLIPTGVLWCVHGTQTHTSVHVHAHKVKEWIYDYEQYEQNRTQ